MKTSFSEPESNFLTHIDYKTDKTILSEKRAAQQLTEAFVQQLESIGYNFDNLSAIGCDSTRTNTGMDGGMVRHLENQIGRKLNYLICCLHLVELPLRHLNINFIGS